MRIVRDTNINFMNQRKVASIFSAVVIISGLVSLLINGGPKLSIDLKVVQLFLYNIMKRWI